KEIGFADTQSYRRRSDHGIKFINLLAIFIGFIGFQLGGKERDLQHYAVHYSHITEIRTGDREFQLGQDFCCLTTVNIVIVEAKQVQRKVIGLHRRQVNRGSSDNRLVVEVGIKAWLSNDLSPKAFKILVTA